MRPVSTPFVRCTSMAQGRVGSYLESPLALDDNSLVERETPHVVLVVEDDSAVRAPLVKFLQMRQYIVVAADTADEGVAAVQSHKPAVAIIDLDLRAGSGRDVLAAIPGHTPVIIFSSQRADTAAFESRPLTRVVPKPYSLMMLMETLQDMLEPGGSGKFGRAAAS
jgi:DNA-binding response OmpR family regulator